MFPAFRTNILQKTSGVLKNRFKFSDKLLLLNYYFVQFLKTWKTCNFILSLFLLALFYRCSSGVLEFWNTVLYFSTIAEFSSVMLQAIICKHIYMLQKRPFRGVIRKSCSENMQQIYRRTHMPKYGFNKVAFATLLKSHFGMGVLL